MPRAGGGIGRRRKKLSTQPQTIKQEPSDKKQKTDTYANQERRLKKRTKDLHNFKQSHTKQQKTISEQQKTISTLVVEKSQAGETVTALQVKSAQVSPLKRKVTELQDRKLTVEIAPFAHSAAFSPMSLTS